MIKDLVESYSLSIGRSETMALSVLSLRLKIYMSGSVTTYLIEHSDSA